jgi:hypothetical protein
MSRSPYKKVSRTPYRKCLALLTDKTLDFWYNGAAQTRSSNIVALVVTLVREGGESERSAADLYLESNPGGWSAVFVQSVANYAGRCHTAPSDVWMETIIVTVAQGYKGPLTNLL